MTSERTFIIAYAIVKGAIVGGVAAALSLSFVQGIIVALVSGSLGFAGAITAAIIARNATRENRIELEHIKRKMGAANRAEDKPSE